MTRHKLILSALLALRGLTLTADAQAQDRQAECQASADMHYQAALYLETSGEAPWPEYADGEFEASYAACMLGVAYADARACEEQAGAVYDMTGDPESYRYELALCEASHCQSETGWAQRDRLGWHAYCGDAEGRAL